MALPRKVRRLLWRYQYLRQAKNARSRNLFSRVRVAGHGADLAFVLPAAADPVTENGSGDAAAGVIQRQGARQRRKDAANLPNFPPTGLGDVLEPIADRS